MTKVKDIYAYLCEFAPLELQTAYDNSGFLIGHADKEVHHVLLSMDVTDEVVEEAIEKGAELIISHHPLIWDKLSAVTDENCANRKLLCLLENQIAVISMHTNLDITDGGVNDVLIELLGAENDGCFEAERCGRRGHLAEALVMTDFLALCKEKLKTNGLRYYDAQRPVQNIAVLGGSGGGNLIDAFIAGCDTYLTADVKYHTFLQARELGINLIDGDHFCTENPVIYRLVSHLTAAFSDLVFEISERHDQTVCFF